MIIKVPKGPKPKKQTAVPVPVDAAGRATLIKTLETMPDEAFGWLVMMWATGDLPWGSGLGGFKPESRASIENLRTVAKLYAVNQSKG